MTFPKNDSRFFYRKFSLKIIREIGAYSFLTIYFYENIETFLLIFKHCELFLWFFIKYIQNFPYTDFVSWIVLSDTSQVKFFKKRELRPRNVHARSNHEYSRSQNRQKSKYCFWWKEHLSDSCQVRSKLGKITPKK